GNEADGKIYARFAGASYCSNKSVLNWKCTHCMKIQDLIEDIKILEDRATETRGYIAINNKRKEIIISFRGNSNLQNWLLSVQIGKTLMTFDGKSYNVHAGFKKAADALFPVVSSNLGLMLSSYPQYKVVVTGHSFGAAIASLMALRLKGELNLNDNQLRLYTYGAPRIGDANFARFVNQNRFTIGRFVNANDVVPHLTAEIINFTHHQQELWVNGMSTKLCSTSFLEDPECSYKEWYRPSPDAHLEIWGIPL
ncbi:alpha/beta-hydrolase, partial [Neoconidiobolus thromboides FSU 785]